jgi:molecular chaperone DnaJ
MAQRDPYSVLGVDRKASADEIKKAYRKLARQYHPDRNPDDASSEERFKEIQSAYDIVGDADKRKQYDRGGIFFGSGGRPGGGPAGAGTGQGGFGGFDAGGFGDILSNLFGGANKAGGGAAGTRTRAERGADLEAEVTISFEQSIEGAQIPLSVAASQRCTTCQGTGAKPGTAPKVCPRCQGRGLESQGQGLFSISQPCTRCGGAGTVIEDPCPTCNGAGSVRTTKRYRVNIPPGVREGSRVRLAGKGEPGRNGAPSGDLFVITHVHDNPVFKRKGDNVEVEVPLTIPEAIRGAEVEVPTLHGSKRLRVPAGTHHGTVQRLRGEGPPKLGSGARPGRGDIHYRFVIDVPASLSTEQSEAVEKLSEVMNGNPRAKLFAQARGGS